MKRQACAVAIAVALTSPAFAADSCNQKMTAGSWVARCEGLLPSPSGLADARILATCSVSKDAFWNCAGVANVGGAIVNQTLQGQAQNHADCTGFISYQQQINGQPAPPLDAAYVILDGGERIWGLPVSGGITSCTLRRLSRDQSLGD
ncbi:MAG TPA: hypothetical protein VGI14_22785 [Casimicrobiaceae bacterium]|jgi:hypothetical protein